MSTEILPNDTDFLHAVLLEGPATNKEILRRSFQERGEGLTVHSRVSDLRRRVKDEGLTVKCEAVPRPKGDKRSEYRYSLVSSDPLVVSSESQ